MFYFKQNNLIVNFQITQDFGNEVQNRLLNAIKPRVYFNLYKITILVKLK